MKIMYKTKGEREYEIRGVRYEFYIYEGTLFGRLIDEHTPYEILKTNWKEVRSFIKEATNG